MPKHANEEITLTDGRVIRSETDWDKLDSLTDEEFEAAVRDDPDAAPIMDAESMKYNVRVWDMPGDTLCEKLRSAQKTSRELYLADKAGNAAMTLLKRTTPLPA